MKKYNFKYGLSGWLKIFSVLVFAFMGVSISVAATFVILTIFDIPPIPEVNETWYTISVLGAMFLVMVAPSLVLIFQVAFRLMSKNGTAQISDGTVVIKLGRKSFESKLCDIEEIRWSAPGLGIWKGYFSRINIVTLTGQKLTIVTPLKKVKTLHAFYEALLAEVSSVKFTV